MYQNIVKSSSYRLTFVACLFSYIISAAILPEDALSAGSGNVSFNFSEYRGNVRHDYQFLVDNSVSSETTAPLILNGNQVPVDHSTEPFIEYKDVSGDYPPSEIEIFKYFFGSTDINSSFVEYFYVDSWGTEAFYEYPKNRMQFEPAKFNDVEMGEPFHLGTFTFTNGGIFGSSYFPPELDFSIQTDSAVAEFDNQLFESTIKFVSTLNDPDLTPEGRADWFYIADRPDLGYVGVYEEGDHPDGNTGSIELWGEFGSLNLVEFRNPTDAAFLGSPVPLPSAVWLLGSGFLGLLGVRKKFKR